MPYEYIPKDNIVVDMSGNQDKIDMAKRNEKLMEEKAKQEPVKKAKGGAISSASKRADGCAVKGKTKGRIV